MSKKKTLTRTQKKQIKQQKNDLIAVNTNPVRRSLLFYGIFALAFGAVMTAAGYREAIFMCALGAVMIIHFIVRKTELVIENPRSAEIKAAQNATLIPYEFMSPVAAVDGDGEIIIRNSAFESRFDEDSSHKTVHEIFGIESDPSDGDIVKLDGAAYCVHKIESESGAVYSFEDQTEILALKHKIESDECVAAVVTVDNYDEAISDVSEEMRPKVIAEIDRIVTAWITEAGGIVKKPEKDRYNCVFNRAALDEFTAGKFAVLGDVKESSPDTRIPPTLSVGVGLGGSTLTESDSFARSALEIALGRGGDQVVIKNKDVISYYGGRSGETERRNKVKARVFANALKNYIEQSETIILIGHKTADADSLGACLGIACAAAVCGKAAKIVMDTCDATTKAIRENIEKNRYHEGLFISGAAALDASDKNTLLVICDTHRTQSLDVPALVDRAGKVVVIDHHRRGEDFIADADLVHHEPAASSACEMVCEVLQYIDSRTTISTIDAEVMYAGIVIDTKNFTFKAGVRTFEAAAYLRGAGVDPLKIKRLMQSSQADYEKRAEIVENAERYHDNISISRAEGECSTTLIARAADELLNISGVGASFVLSDIGGGIIGISGRSLGTVNVQVILEALGGGGHMLSAAAQLEGVTLREAYKRLIGAIDNYFEKQ